MLCVNMDNLNDVNLNGLNLLFGDCLERMKEIPDIYENVENPYKHLELASKQGGSKENFFETTVTSYDQAGSLKGWDDI